MEIITQYCLLFFVGISTGIINTLAGGDPNPSHFFMGLPSHVANGTNRIAIVLQSFVGTAGYRSKGVSTFPFNIYLGIAFFGSLIGAQIAVDIEGAVFNRILSIIMLIVVAIIVFKPKVKDLNLPERLSGKYLLYALIGFSLLEFMVDLSMQVSVLLLSYFE